MRDILLRAVREDPEDDLPRAAYADWCEEEGRLDMANFVRAQLMIPGVHPDPASLQALLCREARVGPGWEMVTYPPFPRNLPSTFDIPWLLWQRGFVLAACVPLDALLAGRVAVLHEHPVRHIRLAGKFPLGIRERYAWHRDGAHFGEASLPDAIFDLLLKSNRPGQSNGVFYASIAEALDDLSLALLDYFKETK